MATSKTQECGHVSKEGYVCRLYRNHISEVHKDNHFHHSWSDDE